MAITYPPGPRSGMLQLVQAVLKGEKFDMLSFADFVNENFGGMSYVKFGPITFYQISDTEIVHEILVDKADKFHKANMVKAVFRPMIGNG